MIFDRWSENMFDVLDFAVFMITGNSYRRVFQAVNTEQAPVEKLLKWLVYTFHIISKRALSKRVLTFYKTGLIISYFNNSTYTFNNTS